MGMMHKWSLILCFCCSSFVILICRKVDTNSLRMLIRYKMTLAGSRFIADFFYLARN